MSQVLRATETLTGKTKTAGLWSFWWISLPRSHFVFLSTHSKHESVGLLRFCLGLVLDGSPLLLSAGTEAPSEKVGDVTRVLAGEVSSLTPGPEEVSVVAPDVSRVLNHHQHSFKSVTQVLLGANGSRDSSISRITMLQE